MTANTPKQTSLDLLISLKSQYEFALTEASSKAGYLREQLAHVNALLLSQLLPSKLQPLPASIEPAELPLALSAHIESSGTRSVSTPVLPTAETVAEIETPPTSKSRSPRSQKLPSAKSASKVEKKPSKRNSLTLLPAYAGLLKLDAIAKVLEAERNQEVSIDSVVQSLYGNLSAAEHKAERLRMKTALFQGVKKGLWQKATTPSSYFVGSLKQGRKTAPANSAAKTKKAIATSAATETVPASKRPKSKTPSASLGGEAYKATSSKVSKRNSLPLLPEYADMKKLDAIALVLEKNRDEVLHQDTIIQMLYGDLSLADLKAERVRIKTALLTGVKNKRWEKSPIPSSYSLKSGKVASKSKPPKSPIRTVKPRSSAKTRSSKK